MAVEVTDHPDGAVVMMAMTVQLGGLVMGRAAELLARDIAGRHLVAGLEQLATTWSSGRPSTTSPSACRPTQLSGRAGPVQAVLAYLRTH